VDEVEAFIDHVAAAFPLITKVEELGRSVEDRPLRALCLGACYPAEGQNVSQALFTGMHHAREVIRSCKMPLVTFIHTHGLPSCLAWCS
jgi:hypothetical protein